MSNTNYANSRRAPNVSAYLANLNTVPSAQDVAAQQTDFELDDGLDFLTNAEFFDFDSFTPGLGQQPQKPASGVVDGSQYPYGFQTFPGSIEGSPSTLSSPAQHSLPGTFPQSMQYNPRPGEKRKSLAAGLSPSDDLEESSRVAAEEDKRRRNTAASARFRVKKKQREQALEKQAKDMTDKLTALENKVQQLETENKWLKELITEKSDAKPVAVKSKQNAGERANVESSTETRNDGVGTTDALKGCEA